MHSAVIVEPRKHKALAFVLRNFLTNLSDDWNIIIFHGNTNVEYILDILDTQLSHYKSRITLHNLHVDNLTLDTYSTLLKRLDFYDKIPTETFLIFQTDTMIIEKHKALINSFMHYDYVGAPWNQNMAWTENKYKVGNGGLSLRKKSKMIEIINTSPTHTWVNEDVFFSHPDHVALNKPSAEDAMKFSIETIFSDVTFGCHKPWDHIENDILFATYPEIKELYLLHNL